MGLGAFYWEVIRRAFSGRLLIAEKISGGFALFFGAIAGSYGWDTAMIWVPPIVFAAVFVTTVVIGVTIAPHRIYREERKRRVEAEKLLELRPKAELFLINEGDQWWVEVRSDSADAEYTAMIDFTETTYKGFGRDPSFVQWSYGTSTNTKKYIPAGGRARFFLYGIENHKGMWQAKFRYIRGGRVHVGRSRYSWTDLSDPPTPVHELDKGILTVILTADPPLQTGSQTSRFRFDGHSVSVISGDVQALE
jgi:hypothetical protein